MSTKSSAAPTPTTASAMDTPDFIRRLAEDQRIRSGSDLPLSCFIEQVKMQLKGRPANDVSRIPQDRIARRSVAHVHQTSELFKAWAMPE
ncbi:MULTISPECIES: hypothetical protein [unclassified Rhizobium]|uniref:hypothetical protein n=1 Tax=unclassified Rhizobium TaxID=2613769 RepID=UPI001ADCDEFC|nr:MULTISPECIES: hypothetical protein [unclassified Rhizobium]MBO9099065.1 hypothetical protein [Rhizobium sp. L58/93]MBO9132128.1 hypothetical protein [Rhizobium sp. B209b/85]MBO9169328.1 hypothetical protein [Rhizobium sp. L245/93]MBO9185280.1 hypothetical protein [Rhizobium sp. E27B/91]QXZ85422.1 hypothetical protein J5287_07920 [Rhizobium sp. K1/93]